MGNTFYARFENLHMNFKVFGRQPLIEPAVLALRFTFLCSLSVSRTQYLKKKGLNLFYYFEICDFIHLNIFNNVLAARAFLISFLFVTIKSTYNATFLYKIAQ